MALIKKLGRLLADEFPSPDHVDLRDEDGIIGIVTSKRFRKLSSVKRQEMLHKILKKHLTSSELRRVVIVIAVTPEEELADRVDATASQV